MADQKLIEAVLFQMVIERIRYREQVSCICTISKTKWCRESIGRYVLLLGSVLHGPSIPDVTGDWN